jgi:uncharacterized protein (DUF934 family)
MPLEPVIRNDRVESDAWQLVGEPAESLPDRPAIVPVRTWIEHRSRLQARGDVGVWLEPDDDPALLKADLAALPLIAVHFPKWGDGRGYSTGALLRRLGFSGELRAFGDIGRDHLLFLKSCGFDAFKLPDTRDSQDALAAFTEFSVHYQGATDDSRPLFRRRAE